MWRRVGRNLEEILGCSALTIVIISVCWGVLSRWLLRHPAPWADELAAITFTWAVFMGASAAFKRNLHIGIDLMMKNLPPMLRRVLMFGASLTILLFCLFMVAYGFIFAINAYKQPTSVLRVPNTYFYISVPFAFFFMTIHQLRVIQRLIFPRIDIKGE